MKRWKLRRLARREEGKKSFFSRMRGRSDVGCKFRNFFVSSNLPLCVASKLFPVFSLFCFHHSYLIFFSPNIFLFDFLLFICFFFLRFFYLDFFFLLILDLFFFLRLMIFLGLTSSSSSFSFRSSRGLSWWDFCFVFISSHWFLFFFFSSGTNFLGVSFAFY